LSRVHEDELAALDFQNGLIVDLGSEHFKSPEYLELVERAKDMNSTFPDIKVCDHSEHSVDEPVHDSYNCKLWVPKRLIGKVLEKAHDHDHGGIHKTFERVCRYYFWPGLVGEVKRYVSACETYKASKAPNLALRTPLEKPSESQRFFQKLYIDLLGPHPRSRSGNIDIFFLFWITLRSLFFLHAVKKMTTNVVVKYL